MTTETETKTEDTNTINTSCKDCVFAEWNKNEQTGCELGRISKFKKNGTEVVEATDNVKDYYVVRRFCNAYRPEAWGEMVEDKTQAIKEETKIRCGVVIVANKKASMTTIEKTVEASLKQSVVLPDYIVIVNNSDIKHHDIIFRMHDVISEDIVFYAVQVREEKATIGQCVDMAFNQAKNGYYIVFLAGYEPPPNFLDKINNRINKELDSIIFIEPQQKWNGLFVQCSTHKLLGGNYEKTLLKKISEIVEEEGMEGLVVNWKDLNDSA